jgi:hypothetical protein
MYLGDYSDIETDVEDDVTINVSSPVMDSQPQHQHNHNSKVIEAIPEEPITNPTPVDETETVIKEVATLNEEADKMKVGNDVAAVSVGNHVVKS